MKWLSCFAALFLLGCGGLSKKVDAHHPDVALPQAWQTVQDPEVEAAADLTIDDLVPLESYRSLIRRALDENPDLQLTALQIREADLLVRDRRGARLPEIGLTVDGRRDKSAQAPDDPFTTVSGGFNLSWELDVWGRLADAEAAARLDREAARATYQAARRSLAARVVQRALDILNVRRVIAIERQRLEVLETNEEIVTARYRAGRGELADLETARRDSRNARAALAALEEDANQAHRALRVLLGDLDMSHVDIPDTVPDVPRVPAGMPAQSLAQRPDLAAALTRIRAEDRRAEAAHKALLPAFRIGANWDRSGGSPSDMLEGSPLWSLLGNLTAPLFQGGRLRANAQLAELAAERAYWSYRNSLLTSVLEVETALSRERAFARQIPELEAALTHATASRRHFEERYREGLGDILDLLAVQQTEFDLNVRLNQTRIDRLGNRIDLALALGLGVSE
ncbi:TolC family protein [Sulfidibacter corallicola]|uniref:TolC family protein n=1 Tax=Sulfidibacter corallicola TaxID=2818388 RepID=A0A8A4TMY0_SULCO|nr:TolC family protein [Sulfidibacter corallicola]QTD50564.1 TolC family protein [Sulfidibacter corallicola]